MGELGSSPCPEECRGASSGRFRRRTDGFVPFRHCARRADRAEVLRQSARFLEISGNRPSRYGRWPTGVARLTCLIYLTRMSERTDR
eukprot:6090890-Prymnesium_polylepis.1